MLQGLRREERREWFVRNKEAVRDAAGRVQFNNLTYQEETRSESHKVVGQMEERLPWEDYCLRKRGLGHSTSDPALPTARGARGLP